MLEGRGLEVTNFEVGFGSVKACHTISSVTEGKGVSIEDWISFLY
jgi:hypothetical protein